MALLTRETYVKLLPADLLQLSKLLGRNISSSADLMLAARNMSTLSIEGLEGSEITLDPYLLNRLRSRCHTTEDFGKFVRERIIEQLTAYCGC